MTFLAKGLNDCISLLVHTHSYKLDTYVRGKSTAKHIKIGQTQLTMKLWYSGSDDIPGAPFTNMVSL